MMLEKAVGSQAGRGELVGDAEFVFAASAAQNTEVEAAFPLSLSLAEGGIYLAMIVNPSAITALSGKVVMRTTIGATAENATLYDGLDAVASLNGVKLLQGVIPGAVLVVSNDTALGVGEGFTATVRVWKV